jgi:hypothetical protein
MLAIQNLMEHYYDALIADAPVLALLQKGADGVVYDFRSTLKSAENAVKPFINITWIDAESTDELSHNIRYDLPIIIEYYRTDKLDSAAPLSYMADIEKVKDVIVVTTSKEIVFGADKAMLEDEGLKLEKVYEGGNMIARFTLNYRYLENK